MKEYKLKINGNEYAVAINKVDDTQASVTVNGTDYTVEVGGITSKPKIQKVTKPAVPAAEVQAVAAKVNKPAAGGAAIKSPLPGVILDIAVKEGDHVKAGQRLMVLEAMKMENNIDSDKEGTVKSIPVRKGDSVLEGDVLLTIE